MCVLDFEENLGFPYVYYGNGSGSTNIIKLYNSNYWYIFGDGRGDADYLEKYDFIIINWNLQCLI
jgi:hypothetical protein